MLALVHALVVRPIRRSKAAVLTLFTAATASALSISACARDAAPPVSQESQPATAHASHPGAVLIRGGQDAEPSELDPQVREWQIAVSGSLDSLKGGSTPATANSPGAPGLGGGCFTADYPKTEWREISCAPSINKGPHNVLLGSVFSPVGAVQRVDGFFPHVKGFVSLNDSQAGPNKFSLQLNSNGFLNPPGLTPGTSGVQQFILDSDGDIFIEYWMMGNGGNLICPGGWHSNAGNCYRNSTNSQNLHLDALSGLMLAGVAVAGSDSVMGCSAGNCKVVPGDNSVGLSTGWTRAEFNIRGYANSSQVNFNAGTTIEVQQRIYPSFAFTLARAEPFFAVGPPGAYSTAETSNLTLVPITCQFSPGGGAPVGVKFTESNVVGAGPASFCESAQAPLQFLR